VSVDRIRVPGRTRGVSETEFGLDGRPRDVDQENVLDLIEVLENERRFHAAAAVMASDPMEGERYRAMAREAGALLANIRHDLARMARRRLSRRERAREMERYAYRLMARSHRPRRRRLSSNFHLQGAE
jgi:hypothetical protein